MSIVVVKSTINDIELDNGQGTLHGHVSFTVSLGDTNDWIDEATFYPFDNNGQELPEERLRLGQNQEIERMILLKAYQSFYGKAV